MINTEQTMMMRRRKFVFSALGFVASPTFAQVLPGPMQYAFVAPNASGSGTTWDDPASLFAINEMILRVGGGGVVVLADTGEAFKVDTPVEISSGGLNGNPVTITGGNNQGQPAPVRLHGNRLPWSGAQTPEDGVDASNFLGDPLFVLTDGAANLRFTSLDISNFGCFLDMTALVSKNILVENVTFTNLRDGIVTNGQSSVEDVLIRRFSGRGFSKKAIRFHGSCANWRIEDCELDSAWQYGDRFAVGIEANDTAHGLHIAGGYTVNCLDTQDGDEEKYWNGDGVASERGNYDILIEGHRSAGNSDSGYDLKSEATVVRNCISENNKRNFRIWGGIGLEPIRIVGCASLTPRKQGGSGGTHHIWLNGADEVGDNAASVIFSEGRMEGGETDTAIYADGANVAIHLVNANTQYLPLDMALFEASKPSSKIMVGSINDRGVTSLLSDSEITAISGATQSVTLQADDISTWRIASAGEGISAHLDDNVLTFGATDAKGETDVVVQARDTRGEAKRFSLRMSKIENPVAPGAVFALGFQETGARLSLYDRTGLNKIIVSDKAQISAEGFEFVGKESYFAVENGDNFNFSGPFSIQATLQLQRVKFSKPPDIITVWNTSGKQRSFRLGLNDDGELAFYWSTDGELQEENLVVGPVVEAGRQYEIVVERASDGIIRLYVDANLVAQSPRTTGPLHPSKAALRVSGRPDGDRAAFGRLNALTILKGFPN